MKTLLIDDMRDLPATFVARDYFAGIEALENHEWDVLLLDHDLATWDDDGNEKTGYDVMCWLEEHPEHLPRDEIRIVSANPIGRQRMQIVIDKLYNDRLPDYFKPVNNTICPLCDRFLPESEVSSHHLRTKLKAGSSSETVNIHRVCHSKIHSLFTESELYYTYNTIYKLKEHADIQTFIKWVSKKDPTFYDSNKLKR
jgi:hypothetical protein